LRLDVKVANPIVAEPSETSTASTNEPRARYIRSVHTDVDVLIVGGGPAGLAAGQHAARAGRVMVVHRDAEIGRPVRTSGGSWKSHLASLGIPERCYHEIDQLLIAAPNRRVNVVFGADRPVVLDVTETYRYLAERALEAGVSIECGTAFIRVLEEGENTVRCLVRKGDSEHEITARYVVDASGHHRAVLRQIGEHGRPERFGVGIEAEFENAGTEPTRAVLFVGNEFSPAGYGWIFPTKSNTVRVGIGIIRPDTKASPSDLLNGFLASQKAAQLGLSVGNLIEKHFGVIPSDGALSTFLHHRILAVGDAAGQALALVGEGIRYGIEAGREAGNALSAALDKPAGAEASLRAYQDWWNEKYRRRFALAQRTNEKMGRFSDKAWHDATGLLTGLSGDEMATLLRMDFSRWQACKLAWRGGVKGAFFFLRQLLR
jgi:digeranylgeranylglycerophospholipid reductase